MVVYGSNLHDKDKEINIVQCPVFIRQNWQSICSMINLRIMCVSSQNAHGRLNWKIIWLLFSYFSVVVCLRCLLYHILSLIVYTLRENREFVFISIVQFMMNANSRIRLGLQFVFVCLYITSSHYHHCANFIWRH